MPASDARSHPPFAPTVTSQRLPLISFAHYPVTAPPHSRLHGHAHEVHPPATARVLGLYPTPLSLPSSVTSTRRPQPARSLSLACARAPPREPPTPSQSSAATSHRAGPRDRTTPESYYRLAWSLHCVCARSPLAPLEPHLDRAPPEVRIASHLLFSLSLFLLWLCEFTGEGRRWCFTIVPCPTGQPPKPDAFPPRVAVGHGQWVGLCSWSGKTRTPTPGAHWQYKPCQHLFPSLGVAG